MPLVPYARKDKARFSCAPAGLRALAAPTRDLRRERLVKRAMTRLNSSPFVPHGLIFPTGSCSPRVRGWRTTARQRVNHTPANPMPANPMPANLTPHAEQLSPEGTHLLQSRGAKGT